MNRKDREKIDSLMHTRTIGGRLGVGRCVCVLVIRGHSLKQISAKGVMVPVIKVPSYILQGFSIVFKNHTTLVNE